jgi:glutathione S-transferase
MADVKIIGVPQSTYLRAVRIACREKGVAYDLVPAMPHGPELLEVNPLGRMPGFKHGTVKLFETLAITQYIDEAFPGPALRPSDVVERAKMTQWMSAVVDYMYPAVIRRYLMPFYIMAKGAPDKAALEKAGTDAVGALKLFDEALKGRTYLASAQPTLADYLLAPIVYWALTTPETKKGLDGMKSLVGHYNKLGERPSVKATIPPPAPGQQAAAE